MGILDQLRDEAKQKKQHQTVEKSRELHLETAYKARILPKMQLAFHYLQEIVEHLNFVDTQVLLEEYSPRYPQFGPLIQQNYKINTDGFGGYADFGHLMEINLTFFAVGEGAFSYKLQGRNRIEEEISFLHSKNIHFEWKHQAGKQNSYHAVFTITRKIPMRFRFEVDYEQTKIKLIINNHENLLTYRKSFQPEQVDNDLLDEVSRYLLRKDCDFIRLDISKKHKESLHNKLDDVQKDKQEGLFSPADSQPFNLSGRIKSLLGLLNNDEKHRD